MRRALLLWSGLPMKSKRLIPNVAALLLLGALFVVLGAPLTSKQNAQPLFPVSKIKRSQELQVRAVQALREKQFSKAEELLKEALRYDDRNLVAALTLSELYLQTAGTGASSDMPARGLAMFPRHARSLIGSNLAVSDNLNEEITVSASENYSRAFTLADEFPKAARRLLAAYSEFDSYRNAESLLREAAQQNPKNASLLVQFSSVLFANDKPVEAVRVARAAIELAPSDTGYLALGSAYEALENYEGALVAFEHAALLGANEREVRSKIKQLRLLT